MYAVLLNREIVNHVHLRHANAMIGVIWPAALSEGKSDCEPFRGFHSP